MTVTKEQAQMLTSLAIACRPYGAPTWDAAGVMEMIGRVKDRALPEVVLAVIRAAADREAKTPGVIPSNGSHWQEQLKPPKWTPDSHDAHLRCSTCDLHERECRSRWTGDHEFEARHVRHPVDTARTVAELRQLVTTPTTVPEGSS